MKRYCTNCKKEFDFPIKSMSDLDNLVCPECNNAIPKNSKAPAYVLGANAKKNKTSTGEDIATGTIAAFFTIKYYFYVVLAIIGLIAYTSDKDGIVIAMTLISLGIYFVGFLVGFTNFVSGLFFIPLGAIIGAIVLKDIVIGACVGILIVFFVRHILRGFLYKIFAKLVNLGNS